MQPPRRSRFLPALAVAALLLTTSPAASIGASNTQVKFGLDGVSEPPCPFEASVETCLAGGEVSFVLSARNLGPATLTHVEVKAAAPDRVISASLSAPSVDPQAAVCDINGAELVCRVAEMVANATLTVELGVIPTLDGTRVQTEAYSSTATLTAKASTQSGGKNNFTHTETVAAGVTFVAPHADGRSYTDTADGQTAIVTLPTGVTEELFVFLDQVDDDFKFCGIPATELETCFGWTVHLEIEDANGRPHTFENCELSTDPPTGCVRIEIIWDPAKLPGALAMPAAYTLAPELISVYHDGSLVQKCLALLDATAESACSSVATRDPETDWISITAYTDSNGNWGGG